MSDRYAWVTLSGKVHVDHDELAEKLEEKYPFLKDEAERQELSIVDVASFEQEQSAFQDIAEAKLSEITAFTVKDTDIDMTTYKRC